MNNRFQVNAPSVAAEVISDEVMIVNLEAGNYYSLRNTGAEVWTLVEQGFTPAEIAGLLEARYQGDPAEMKRAVISFLEELESEQIIVPRTSAPGNTPAPAPRGETSVGAASVFAAPALEKYTDMQELLQVDPIHDVDDEQGWPKMPGA
jgi:hypothetical protein